MPHAARRPAALAAVSQLKIRACVQELQPIWPPACERVVAASNWAEKRVWRRSWAALGCVLVRHWLVGWLVVPTRFQPRTRSYARLAGMADSRRGADVDPRRPTSLLRAICLQRPAVSLQPLSKYAARPI